jgi:hypothetical protein
MLFLARIILQPLRWGWHVRPKYRLTFDGLRGIISSNSNLIEIRLAPSEMIRAVLQAQPPDNVIILCTLCKECVIMPKKYCDRFHGTSDMDAATQRIRRPSLGNDSVNHAWKQEYWSPLPRQQENKSMLPLQRVKINVLPKNEKTSPWQRILSTVKRFLSNQIVAMEAWTLREGALYSVRREWI